MLTGRGPSNRFPPSDNSTKNADNLERLENGPVNRFPFKSKTSRFEKFPKLSWKWLLSRLYSTSYSLNDENGWKLGKEPLKLLLPNVKISRESLAHPLKFFTATIILPEIYAFKIWCVVKRIWDPTQYIIIREVEFNQVTTYTQQ
ncbi:hypothetical protein V6N13_009324 [Hibiscus sabdariffa]|uniref:Uncharacterized protein n=1 Tax=Hibiscus sabdariffa TaxID=183260 RepID=A0ABR2PP28_9ROSI